jgi:hypothetical protein
MKVSALIIHEKGKTLGFQNLEIRERLAGFS